MLAYYFTTVAPALVLYGAEFIAWTALVVAIGLFVWFRTHKRFSTALWVVLGVAVLAKVKLALLLTYTQYAVWAPSDIGQLFLPPTQPWSYFMNYVGLRYWLALLLALLVAGIWFGFISLLRNRSERFFAAGEIPLITLLVFIVGWPNAVVLFPLAAVLLVGIALVRVVFFKEQLTTFGLPFLIATPMSLLSAAWIRSFFGY